MRQGPEPTPPAERFPFAPLRRLETDDGDVPETSRRLISTRIVWVRSHQEGARV